MRGEEDLDVKQDYAQIIEGGFHIKSPETGYAYRVRPDFKNNLIFQFPSVDRSRGH